MKEVKYISVNELKNCWDDATLVIDVREEDERLDMYIPKTKHLPLSEMPENMPIAHQGAVYIHCKSGMRSIKAANMFLEAGFNDVYSVEGGILAWAEAGYLIEKPHQ